jgi:hypothetical protein
MSVLLKMNSAGCRKFGRQIGRGNKFHSTTPGILGHSVLNWLRVALPAPLILRWLLDFWGSLYTTRIMRFLVVMATIILRYMGDLERGSCIGDFER